MSRSEHTWATRVEWTAASAMGVIAPLHPNGRPLPLEPGSELSVGWPTAMGYVEATARMRGVGDERIATWVLDVRDVQRHQRRSAYRLDVAIPVTVRAADRAIRGTIRDLSEVGLRCTVPRGDAPELGATVGLEFELPDVGEITAQVRVVRGYAAATTEVVLGLAYVDLPAGPAEDLRRFVFDEQLRRRNTTG